MNNNRGSALLITLMIMAMLTIVAGVSVDRSTTDMEMSYNQLHAEQSFYVAEAGYKRALYELNQDNDWRVGFRDEHFGTGYFAVKLVDSSSDSALIESVLVTSAGFVDGGQSTVTAWIVPELNYMFEYGLFGKNAINMAMGSCTDSYNSDSGSYVDTQLDSLGSIGSNGMVITAQFVTIGGDVSTASDTGLSINNKTTINGDTTSNVDSSVFNVVPESEYDSARINSGAPANITGDFTYNPADSSLVTGQDGSVVLGDGVYYFTSIDLGQNSQVTIAPGAEVTIYVTGDILFSQQSTINDGGNPMDLMIFSQGSALTFKQDNTFYGTFYGPDATIEYDQTSQIYGALVGSTINVAKDACFHYDRRLSEFVKGVTGRMLVSAWKEN
ncbi:MAG: pilus assembly PilX N-terminal domain-containing protein [candidate division Zixibacteria bacterium]|nr:pilus assembly PilX N-terminal domain-containing protein [candidate division Zixibacteria bacterium]